MTVSVPPAGPGGSYDPKTEAYLEGPGGALLVFPTHETNPNGVDYLRVVSEYGITGREIGYWIQDEWAEDPIGAMGAIMGAACSDQD
jgi:hypothetical protein